MTSKSIKKIFRILLWFIGVLLFLFTAFYFALRSPAFQTWASNRAGSYFSNSWGTTVRVEGVNIEFWKKIVLEGVYVEDKHGDTLLYAKELKLDIGTFDRDSNNLFIGDVLLSQATIKLKQYKGESDLNFQFIIDEFSSQDTSAEPAAKWNIGIGGISLDNIRFSYHFEEDTVQVKGINFSDLLASGVRGKLSGIVFDADTTSCTIENLSLYEKSGFHLRDFYAQTSISPAHLKASQMKIFSNHSEVIGNVAFRYSGYDDFNHFIDSVKIKAQFNSSNVEMRDIAYFSDELYGIRKKVFFNGDVSGRVSDLRGKNVLLVIGDETSFMGNFSMTGLPDINQTFMSFDAKELRTSKQGIENIPLPPFHEPHSISLPGNTALFGIIKFKGNFSGFYNDFVSYGTFSTELGQISTDISMKEDSVKGIPVYHGKFACRNFNLGRFFEREKYIGRITLSVDLDGQGLRKEDAKFSVQGKANDFELNGYDYKNIDIKGEFAKNIFDGTVAVNDENLEFDFNGNMDFSKSPTHVNFTSEISKANLNKLHILKENEYAGITAKISVNAVGNNIDDVTGRVSLEHIAFVRGTEVYDFKNLELTIDEIAGVKTMDLNSSVADAHIRGEFQPMKVVSSLRNQLADYLPSFISPTEVPLPNKKSKKPAEGFQKFAFDIRLKNTDVATHAFLPSLGISPSASVTGNYDEENRDISFLAAFPEVVIGGYKFKKCEVQTETKADHLEFNTKVQRIAFADSLWIDNVRLVTAAARDTVNFKLNWKNSTDAKYEGNVPGYVSFAGKPKVKIKFFPSSITIADSEWQINAGNEIVVDTSFISIRNLEFTCGRQVVRAEGNISEVKEDQVYFMLNSFSLANFNAALKGTGFSVYGTISGNTSMGNLYDSPVFGSSIEIKKLQMNNELIGDGDLTSVYDSRRKMINFAGMFRRSDAGSMKLTGNYFPFKKDSSLDADVEVKDFHLEFFEPFVKGNFEDIRGSASAEVQVKGTPQKPELKGVIRAKVNNIHVNYLGTNYHFEGEIPVAPNSFDFSGITVYDVNNNAAQVVNGKMYHSNFRDFQLDVDLSTNKFLCLNTTEKDNPVYYGRFFATGIVNVFGYLDNINLSAVVKTDKARNLLGKNEYTQLFIPLSGSEEVGESGFISFVRNDTSRVKPQKYKLNTTGFTMDFKLEVTPEAEVQLIFDEKVGDIIKANGSGNVEMTINQFGEFKMYGDYTVETGDYLFTLKNIVNKKFRLEKGGIIHWSGNPEQAEVDMNAIYEVRSSLTPLFHEHEQTEATAKRYPVDLVMNLSGKLLSPDILFDIRLPTVDDFTRQQAYDRFKKGESEVNKQVFSLLFTNSFSNPPDFNPGETGGGPGAGTVTSTEMLSNQLSNWLSQISNKFDVGVHYRPGDVVNKDEVEVALSTQLFNDKMTIDGSVANNANTTGDNAANIVGDINVDYKLTEDGKLRAKAYNKANEGNILDTQKGPYTQGLGIFYREEFDTLRELYKRLQGKSRKKKRE